MCLGTTRVFDVTKGKEVYVHGGNSEKPNSPIVHLFFNERQQHLYEVNSNHNIHLYNLDQQFSCKKQVVVILYSLLEIRLHRYHLKLHVFYSQQMTAYLDEILNIVFFGENENYLAVAANSCDIHVYDQNMNCSLLKGHTDLVVSLASSRGSPNILVSGGKVIEFILMYDLMETP